MSPTGRTAQRSLAGAPFRPGGAGRSISGTFLELASDGKVRRLGDAVESLADRFDLPFAERNEETSSGNKRFYDRVSFASLNLR